MVGSLEEDQEWCKKLEDEGGKSCKTVQIFVKMDGSRTIAMDVASNDKVSDMMKRIPSDGVKHVRDEWWKISGKK